ncbi:MAG TPA: glycosyltransferase, partial [Spirillospora sp.]
EFDQGQHDGVRDVLAVGSAGMLVRRDVWDRLGGFDVEYGIFRDDLDFCWRVHAAGYRVVTATDAVVYHAEAARRGLREIGMTAEHPARRDRRNAIHTLLANQPFPAMLRALVRNVWASLVHALYLLVTKRPAAAGQEIRALLDVLRSPGRLRRARAVRAQGRNRAHRSVRRFQARGVALRRAVESISEYFAAHDRDDTGDEDASRGPGPVRRFLARPGVMLVLALAAVAVAAERSLLTATGDLGGGALVPAWGGASDLWARYLSGWHPVGLGSDRWSPPYVGILAVLSTVLFGKPWLAVSILLLGSVPLAGLTAYYASRVLVVDAPRTGRRARSRHRRVPVAAVRAWFAAVYALLPAATGAIAGGRLGTAVVHVLLPLIAVHAARVYGFPRGRSEGHAAGAAPADARTLRKRAGRSAWTVALLLAVAMAFVPLTWLIGAVAAAMVKVLFDRPGRHGRRHLLIALGVPPLLLLPWTAGLLRHPSRFLTEAGLHRRFEPAGAADLLFLDPGGPGTPARWAMAGLLAVAVFALHLRGRRDTVLAGWLLAIFGLLVAVLTSAATVTKGTDEAPAWPGVAMIFASAGVLLAATVAVRRAAEVLTGDHLISRAGGAAVVLAALSAPVLAAGFWVAGGAGGPLTEVDPDTVPAFVHTGGARTLVLRTEPTGRVSYTVLRDARPRIGEAELLDDGPARDRMNGLVAGLVAGQEGDAGPALTRMGVQYVVVPHPRSDAVTRALDAAPELTRLSRTGTFAVWRLQSPSARMMLLEGSTVTPLRAGRVDARARIPAGGGKRTLLLAEPADGGWRATLDGRELKGRTVDGWAQGYDIPASGGDFRLTRSMTMRHTWLVVQGLAVLVAAALALPGARTDHPAFTGERRRRRRRRGRGRRHARRSRSRHGRGASEPQRERTPEEVS